MSKKSRRKGLSEKVATRREKPIEKKSNPFELKFNKQKHAVLGQRKQSTAVGVPLLSRHRAFEQRKRTLLADYLKFGKANQIVDKRLGERNPNLTPDQKMALRFAAERRRRYKTDETSNDDRVSSTSNFQLSGVDSILTHRGKALSEIEKLNDRPLLDEDEEADGFGSDFIKLAHFGGGMQTKRDLETTEVEGQETKKTRKELIEEMISNSKKARYEMQMQREKASDLTDDLDLQWKEAIKDNLVSQWIRNGKDDEIDTSKTTSVKGQSISTATTKSKEQGSDYDRLVHEMAFEPKVAKGGEKLDKTEQVAGEADDEPNTNKKDIARRHITGDDDIGDIKRFKRQKEKPFMVRYDSEGRLIQDDAAVEEPSPPASKKQKFTPGIEFFEPRIEANFNPERKKRRPTGKGETVERQKLMQKYKKEFRGTIRELRRDNEFLARQQLMEQQRKDSERRLKVKSLMKSLVSQETECKKLKKKKH